MRPNHSLLAASSLAFAACVSSVPVSNPYDPEAPPEQQAKATLSGTVESDQPGEPVPLTGATVQVSGPTDPAVNPITTGDDGTFNFGEVQPGRYTLDVSHASHFRSVRDLVVTAGEKRTVRVVLNGLPDDSTTDTSGHVSGVAKKFSGDDHSGILVEIEDAGIRTVTNAEGKFDVFLNAGTYNVLFSAQDHQPTRRDGVVVVAGSKVALPNSPVQLSPNPGSVRGNARLEGAAEDGHGNITVSLFGSENTETASDGSYLITGVAAGTYSLTAAQNGFDTEVVQGVRVEGGREIELPDIVLSLSRGTISGQFTLAGRDSHGGILIELTGQTHGAVTNQAGMFAIAGVAVGTYELTARSEGFTTAVVGSVSVMADETTAVAPQQLVADPGSIAGTILLEGASAGEHGGTVVSVAGGISAVTGPDGVFMLPSVEPGVYTLSAASGGFVTHNVVGVVVSAGAETGLPDVTLALARGSIEGIVQLGGRVEHDGVALALSGTTFTAVSNVDGAFLLPNVPVGTYALTARREGFIAAAVGSLTVSQDTVTDAGSLALDPNPGGVTGQVVLEGRAADDNAGINVSLSPGSHTTTTANDGSFAITGVLAGAYQLTATETDFASQTMVGVVVVAGTSLALPTIALLKERGSIAGAVQLQGDDPSDIEDVVVSIPGLGASAFADQNGDYIFADVPVGEYDLVSRLEGYSNGRADNVLVSANAVAAPALMVLRKSTGDFLINGGDFYTASTLVALTLDNPDAATMRISEDPTFGDPGLGDTAYVAYASEPAFTLSPGDGEKTIYVQYTDFSAVESTVFSAPIVLDTTAPDVASIAIDGGAAYTNDAAGLVNLTLTARDAGSGVRSMQISNDTIYDEPFVDYTQSAAHFLDNDATPATDGAKAVYVRFEDYAGNQTAEIDASSASIILDRVPPALTGITLDCNGTTNPTHCNSPLVTVTVTPSDPEPTTAMALSNSGSFGAATFQPFQASTTWLLTAGDGSKTVSIMLEDAAGNATSGTDSDDVIIDTNAPTLNMSLSGDGFGGLSSDRVRSASVTVALHADDDISANVNLMMQIAHFSDFSDGAGTAVPWVAYADSTPGHLLPDPSQSGPKRIYVRVRDEAGNAAYGDATIELDLGSPVLGEATLVGTGGQRVTRDANVQLILQYGDVHYVRLTGDLVGGGDWQSAQSLFAVELTPGAGLKTVTVEAQDDAGNPTSPATVDATITVDVTDPQGMMITLNGGDSHSSERVVAVGLATSSTDVTEVAVGDGAALDCTIADFVPFVETMQLTLLDDDRLQTVKACFRDEAGNVDSTTADITLDRIAPTLDTFTIDGGSATYTTSDSRQVSVDLQATDADTTLAYQISEDANFSDQATWTGLTSAAAVNLPAETLSEGQGLKTLYLRVRDRALNVQTTSASITLDTVHPVLEDVSVQGGLITKDVAVTLMLTAIGADGVTVTGAGVQDGGTGVFANLYDIELTTGAGSKDVTVTVTDDAGNASASVALTLTLDESGPGGLTFELDGGATHTNERVVSVAVGSTDADWAGVVVDEAATLNCATASYIDPVATLQFTLPDTDDGYTLKACFLDAAGNPSEATATITLDRIAPTLDTFTIDGGSATYTTSDSRQVSVDLQATDADTTLAYQISEDANFSDQATWTALTSAAAVNLPAETLSEGQGLKTLYLRVRDRALNVQTTSASITLDNISPSLDGVLVLNAVAADDSKDSDGAAISDEVDVTGALDIVLDINAVGADEMLIGGTDTTYDNANSWVPLASQLSIPLTTSDGDKTITISVRDFAGNVAADVETVIVRLDRTGADPADFTASGHADGTCPLVSKQWVKTPAVPLSITVDDKRDGKNADDTGSGIEAFQVSTDPSFADASWQSWERPNALSRDSQAVLSGDNQDYDIYVQVRDYAGNIASAGTVCVTLDTEPPENAIATADSAYSDDDQTVFTLSATDALADTADLQVKIASGDVSAPSVDEWFAWGDGTLTVTWTAGDGAKSITLRVRDPAGNEAAFSPISQVTVDTTAPVTPPTVSFLDSRNRAARISWTAADDGPGSGIASYEICYTSADPIEIGGSVDSGCVTVGASVLDTLVTGVDGTGLANRHTYSLSVEGIDMAGNRSGPSATEDVAVGWEVLPVVSSLTRALAPQDIIYAAGKVYLLYHEIAYKTPEGGMFPQVGAIAKLAVSEDGGATWRISVVQDASETEVVPAAGRVVSKLSLGAHGLSVVTMAEGGLAGGEQLLDLVEYISEDDGFSWREAVIDDAIGLATEGAYAIGMSATGSSRVVIYNADAQSLGGGTPAAGGGMRAIAKIATSRDDVRDSSGGAPLWWTVEDTAPFHNSPGAHYSMCNANFVDRATWTLGVSPLGRAVQQGQVWSAVSGFHGQGWDPSAPNCGILGSQAACEEAPNCYWGSGPGPCEQTGPGTPLAACDQHATEGDCTGDTECAWTAGACEPSPGYEFSQWACAGLGNIVWFHYYAVSSAGALVFKAQTNRASLGAVSDLLVEPTFSTLVSPGAAGLDPSTPVGAWSDGTALYVVYREEATGRAIVLVGTNLAPNDPNCNGGAGSTVCFEWRQNIVDDSGDAGFNPVMTGYAGESPFIAYTDFQGTEIKLARAALPAPQTDPDIRAGLARYLWNDWTGADTYLVSTADDCGMTEQTFSNPAPEYTFTSGAKCVRSVAVDENGLPGDSGRKWRLQPFGSVVSADTNLVVGSTYSTGLAVSGTSVVTLAPANGRVELRVSNDGGDTFVSQTLYDASSRVHCADHGSQAPCSLDANCQWSGGTCLPLPIAQDVGFTDAGGGDLWLHAVYQTMDTFFPCAGIADPTNCDAESLCQWDGGAGECKTLCNALATAGTCAGDARCWWDGASCAEACAQYAAGGACESDPMCRWDVSDGACEGAAPYLAYKRASYIGGSWNWSIAPKRLVSPVRGVINGGQPHLRVDDSVVAIAYLTDPGPATCTIRDAGERIELIRSPDHGATWAPATPLLASMGTCDLSAPAVGMGDGNDYLTYGVDRSDGAATAAVKMVRYASGAAQPAHTLCEAVPTTVSRQCHAISVLRADGSDQFATVAGVTDTNRPSRLYLGVSSVFAFGQNAPPYEVPNLESDEREVIRSNVAVVGGGQAGLWIAYATRTQSDLVTMDKVKLAYCQRFCNSIENWAVSVVRSTSAAGMPSGTGYAGINLRLSGSQLYLTYDEHDGSSVTQYLLRGGYIEEQAF